MELKVLRNEHRFDIWKCLGSLCQDIDYDGDLDVLSSASGQTMLLGGKMMVLLQMEVGLSILLKETLMVQGMYAKDVDSDGDIDVLAVANIGDDITWWENTANFALIPLGHLEISILQLMELKQFMLGTLMEMATWMLLLHYTMIIK